MQNVKKELTNNLGLVCSVMFNRFSQLKLLGSTRTIDYKHRRIIPQTHNKTIEGQNYYSYINHLNNNNNEQKFNNNPNKFVKRNKSSTTRNLPSPMELGSLENRMEYKEVIFSGDHRFEITLN